MGERCPGGKVLGRAPHVAHEPTDTGEILEQGDLAGRALNLRPTLGNGERARQVSDRRAVGAAANGVIGGLDEIVNGAPMVPSYLEVCGQLGRDGGRLVATAGFLLLADPLVKAGEERAR